MLYWVGVFATCLQTLLTNFCCLFLLKRNQKLTTISFALQCLSLRMILGRTPKLHTINNCRSMLILKLPYIRVNYIMIFLFEFILIWLRKIHILECLLENENLNPLRVRATTGGRHYFLCLRSVVIVDLSPQKDSEVSCSATHTKS